MQLKHAFYVFALLPNASYLTRKSLMNKHEFAFWVNHASIS